MVYAGILQQSTILPRKIVIWTVALIDSAVLVLLALFGPIGGAIAIAALTAASYCLFSPIGFVLMSVLISPVYPLGNIDESMMHIAKLLITGFFLLNTLVRLTMERRSIDFKVGAVEKSLLALLVWGAFCSIFAVSPMDSAKEVLRISVFPILYFLVVESIRERLHVKLILAATLITLLASSLDAMATLSGGIFTRAHGFFQNANAFGQFLLFAIPTTVMGLVLCRKSLTRLMFGTVLALGVIALLLSWSRAAILSVGVQGIVFLIIEKKRKALLVLVALTLLVAAVSFASPQLRTTLSTVMRMKSGTTHRAVLWENAMKVFLENPALGLGLRVQKADVVDNIMWNDLANVALFSAKDTSFSPHNVYINMLMTTGLPGLVLFLLFYRSMIRDQWRSRKSANVANQRLVHSIMVSLLVGTLAHGFFETASIFSWSSTAVYFWIALGMVEAIRRKNLLEEPETTVVAARS